MFLIKSIFFYFFKAEHFLFDEDLLVFENVPSRKKRANVANVLEIGSGSPEGMLNYICLKFFY